MYQLHYVVTRTGVRSRLACLLIASALLGGCATQPAESSRATPTLDAFARDADAELAKGNRDQAVAVLTQSARSYPTSAAPWLKIANIWFDAANYPSAILAANEALQRDAASQEAKSLLVVGGLRVAAGAVAGLRPTPGVGSNVRSEAETLTNSLRAAIGETTLVPALPSETRAAPVPKRSRARPVRPLVKRKEVTGSSANVNVNTTSRGTAGTSNDPFKSLK